jgi:hypothetical protein
MLTRVVAGCLVIGFVALQSCTAVLGMERATLDLSGDGSVTVESTSPCTAPPTADCTGCLELKCGTSYANCIADSACRRRLDDYALCIGNGCHGISPECLNTLDSSLTTCVGQCASSCGGTTLATPCDLYCACMPVCDTAAFQAANPTMPVLKGQDCLTKCAEDSKMPGLVPCLRSHCELGKGAVNHCFHATGEDPLCQEALTSGVAQDPAKCLGLNLSGWYCDKDDECCSGDCVGTGACN